jgi:hypothetical protein
MLGPTRVKKRNRTIQARRGLTGTFQKVEMLDGIMTHVENIYQQLTAHTKWIANMSMNSTRSARP